MGRGTRPPGSGRGPRAAPWSSAAVTERPSPSAARALPRHQAPSCAMRRTVGAGRVPAGDDHRHPLPACWLATSRGRCRWRRPAGLWRQAPIRSRVRNAAHERLRDRAALARRARANDRGPPTPGPAGGGARRVCVFLGRGVCTAHDAPTSGGIRWPAAGLCPWVAPKRQRSWLAACAAARDGEGVAGWCSAPLGQGTQSVPGARRSVPTGLHTG